MSIRKDNILETDLYITNKLRSTSGDLVLGGATGKIVLDDNQTLSGNIDATKIQGKLVSNTQPIVGQFLGWDGNKWISAPTPSSSFAHQITVAKQGGNFTTIEAAIQAAVSLVPSQSNPILIRIYPGTYNENNTPLTIPSWISIQGVDNKAVIIKPSNSNTNLFDLRGASSLKNCTLRDCKTAITISNTSMTTSAIIENCIFTNTEIGCHVSQFEIFICRNTTFETPNVNDVINVCIQNEGYTVCNNVAVTTLGYGTISKGFVHAGLTFIVDDGSISGCSNTAIHIDSLIPGATFSMSTFQINHSAVGIYIDNGILQATAALIDNCVVHIHVAENAIFVYNSMIFDMNLVTIHQNAIFYGNGVTDQVVERRNRLIGNVNIGEVNQYSTFVVGSGGTYTRGMIVQSNSDGEAGTWVNHTIDASDPLGNIYNAFPNTNQNNVIYFGADQKFVGIIQFVFSEMIGGSVVFEYWNGSSWQQFNIFATLQDYPHTIFRSDVFRRDWSIENIRFDTNIFSNWTTRTLNTYEKYWVRARVLSNLTTGPMFGHIRIRASSTVIGDDGFVEYFGTSQPSKTLTLHKRIFNDTAGDVAVNVDVPISLNINLSGYNNRFNANIDHSIIGIVTIPDSINTSEPLTVTVKWFREGTGGTAIGIPVIRLRITYIVINDDTIIDGNLSDNYIDVDINVLPDAKKQQKTIFKVPISNITSDGLIALKLERKGTEDTYDGSAPNGSIVINSVKCEAKSWCA